MCNPRFDARDRRRGSWGVSGVSRILLLILLGLSALACAACGQHSPQALLPAPDQRVKLLGIPDEYRGLKNPLPATSAALEEGEKRYQEHCVLCHAREGSGNTPLGRALYPHAGDLRLSAAQAQSDGELFWMIAQGIRYSGMPAARSQLTEEQTWDVVLYVRALGGRLR
jgi:mono/diheme cytochrome c family protein